MQNRFYITTALPYINAPLHLGFTMELIQADALARYHRLIEEDTYFVTGSDENALKNVQAAEKAGIPVKEFVDQHVEKFIEFTKKVNLSINDFIRTTENRHVRSTQKLWQLSDKAGDIYKKKYKGLYCTECEEFKTSKELVEGLCSEHKIVPEEVGEENYFFRLSKYQKQIEELIDSDKLKIIPATRKNEVREFVRQGLQDFSISRSQARAKNWGIQVPGDQSQRIFVWFDALINYLSVLGFAEDGELFKKYWQENNQRCHLVGKGITRFHAIYWPAMLLSAGIKPPTTIFVHGYLNLGGEKMSKSVGNVVDPFDVVKKYGVDPVRYYLLREIPSYEDGDWSDKKFEARYNADLANNFGNLVSRTVALIEKFFNGSFAYSRKFVLKEVDDKIIETWKKYNENINNFKLHIALENVFSLADFANLYIDEHKPWSLAVQPEHLNEVMTNLVVIILNVAWLLKPFLPETSDRIFGILGADKDGKSWEENPFQVKPSILFPKLQ